MGVTQAINLASAPGGANKQVQFNDGNHFGGSAYFTFDKTKGQVDLKGASTIAVLGTDLVTNGNFTGTATGWTLAASWAYSANNVIHTAGSAGDIQQVIAVEAGKMYEVKFTTAGRTAGTLTPKIGTNVGTAVSTNAAQTQYIYVSTTGNLIFSASSTFDGTLDTVSVKGISTSDPILRFFNTDGSSVIEMRGGGDTSAAYENTLIGLNAGWRLVTGHSNVGLGDHTLEYATTASWNTAIGNSTLSRLTTGIDNTVVGVASAPVLTTGSYNTAIGESNVFSLIDGNYNCAVGEDALYYSVSGSSNVAVGRRALQNSLSDDNVAVGTEAFRTLTSGSKNTSLGNYAGFSNSTGSSSVYLGYKAGYNETGSSKLWIANSDTSKLITGDFATGRVGINTSAAGSTLHVQGAEQLWDASDNSGALLKFLGSNTQKNFLIGNQNNLNAGLEITPSTAAGGSTFTTPIVGIFATNVGVGTGTTAADASAVLELKSTTLGLLPPRMTTAQKNAVSAPTEGLIVYDTTLHKLCVRVAAAWETITSV